MLFNRYQRQTIEFLYQENLAREKSFCDSDMEKEIDRKWFEEYLHQVAEKLPPARKKIFILSRLKDLSTKQIAEMMQISVSTVEIQLTLALRPIPSVTRSMMELDTTVLPTAASARQPSRVPNRWRTATAR